MKAIPLTAVQKREIDRRLAACRRNPSAGSSRADVKKRLIIRSKSPALRVSDAAAAHLVHEARAELEAGTAQIHQSPSAFASAMTKSRRRAARD
jgi:hypothetical protein